VGRLERTGELWRFTWDGRQADVRHLKDVGDIAVLLARPHTEVPAISLMGGSDTGVGMDTGIDATARRAYEDRIIELQQEVDEARDANDVDRVERAELELDVLVSELSRSLGLGGRTRTAGGATERARAAVTHRIRAAISRIEGVHPRLAHHLRHSVRTGTWCSYAPEDHVEWTLTDG